MSLPQSVTRRYASNLLLEGSNDVFAIEQISEQPHVVGGDRVGYFYMARVKTQADFTVREAAGATPRQAVERALEKLGVTFQ